MIRSVSRELCHKRFELSILSAVLNFYKIAEIKDSYDITVCKVNIQKWSETVLRLA